MSSPVKAGPPTALDRAGDRERDRETTNRETHRFGHDGPLTSTGLPMPGLSGRANSPTGNIQQATCLKALSTTTASSRAPRLWSASSSTSKPRCTSQRASAATCSWGCIKPGHHQPQQRHCNPTSPQDDDSNRALIAGLFFLGGSRSDDGGEFQCGNARVRLQIDSQGFVFGVGRRSISILRITLRFKIYFMDGRDFGLNRDAMGTEIKQEQSVRQENDSEEGLGVDRKSRIGNSEGQHSLALTLTMTVNIVAVNTSTLS
ncbi:hypothetical protein F4777DRAFT_500677 [Nemania sp. FL0916]|nr:hypothetical protein F4777DRAFT_500677 [Nemania sp. FL0916]